MRNWQKPFGVKGNTLQTITIAWNQLPDDIFSGWSR